MTKFIEEKVIGNFEANFLDGDKIDDCGKCMIAVDK